MAPSDRFSTLRGLASSASGLGGSGENNLAFKCTRKRLIFETLHLDLDGGVSERRTSAPSSAATEGTMSVGSTTATGTARSCGHDHTSTGAPKIAIEVEQKEELPKQEEEKVVVEERIAPASNLDKKPKKPKKKVAFFSDRPDVYDF